MTPDITKINSWLLAFSLIACAPSAQALCFKVKDVGTGLFKIPQAVADKGYTATSWGGFLNEVTKPINFPTIIMGTGAERLAPAGTVMASATLPFLEWALNTPYTANQIVFKCALSDADSLYELYAVNAGGGEFYGGKAVSDVPDAYQSPASNLAFRITNLKTGRYYTQKWQQRKLTEEDYIVIDSMIYIPASAFSGAIYELIKTDDVFGAPKRNPFEGILAPQGFVAFKGNGINTDISTGGSGQTPGQATSTSGVWSMLKSTTTVIHGNACTLGEFDPVVNLPPISANDLRNGSSSQQTFNVAIECEKGAISGTTSSETNAPVAVGFLVTQATALTQAETLKLKTASGGVSHLLDDNYGTSGVASGVGIRIYSSNGQALNLLSSSATTGNGSGAGWYGFADLMSETGLTSSGGTAYAGTFTASLEQFPNSEAQSGSVNAQAQIIVSLQ
ncbi:fimbrial usher protein StbD [Pantoea anthophila]|uniref:fimbrial usher protein StbD n=1 Tax=Pantoea anthophila TaxID=470931 RepID=UPI0027847A1A|nr:fimbrial usher protein StbD [Pantoea anthophila]MDQ1215034.1 type 1 fimbria pilin [Pantoea anthophila]